MQPWTVRTIVRTVVMSLIAGLGVAATIWVDNPYIRVASAMAAAIPTYLGIGYVSEHVEPFLGPSANNRIEVPAPPETKAVREVPSG